MLPELAVCKTLEPVSKESDHYEPNQLHKCTLIHLYTKLVVNAVRELVPIDRP